MESDTYPPIEDYALLSDCESTAPSSAVRTIGAGREADRFRAFIERSAA